MKKFLLFTFMLALSVFTLLLSGCDENGPTKIGGGGHQQSYDSSTGRYN